MARDRQRAKQRRRRQQSGGPAARSAARTAKARDIGLDDATVDDAGLGGNTPAPDPLKHSSADVDEAKLAEAGAIPPPVGDADDAYDGAYDDFDDAERAPDEAEEGLLPAAPSDDPDAVDHPRRSRGRVLTFLRHSADELRRVQWPTRRQVGQATAVVLGFVVLAGGYLGLLDAIWKPIIDAIL
ncbi:MAG: preprotein translocase subunit SecE [Solirubrobacteraceae bacterium]|jgi:preprotein translocase SecE subunit|nr:preprotein translocase subunit SecE [Solirubrobacteraceae bacterium]